MKEKMITRTMFKTVANVSIIDIPSKEISDVMQTFVGKVSEDKLLKMCRKAIESDVIKVLSIEEVTYIETLYGMTETEFMNHAVELPARNVKKEE